MHLKRFVTGAFALVAVVCCSCEHTPKIPHAIADRSDAACDACHREAANDAPATPHPDKKDCLSCHE